VSDWNGEMCICAQGYNVLLFLIFIWKYSQKYLCTENIFYKICRTNAVASIVIPEKGGRISEFFFFFSIEKCFKNIWSGKKSRGKYRNRTLRICG
jgi:hypothetical protein